MARRTKKQWADMSTCQRVLLVVGSAVQISLAVAAWVDLARRRPEQVKGPKSRWAGIIGINFVGPVLYFVLGRERGA